MKSSVTDITLRPKNVDNTFDAYKKTLNSRRQKIISEMRDNPNITMAELHNILGVSETAVGNNISFL